MTRRRAAPPCSRSPGGGAAYARALERQMGYAQQILHALGYEGAHFSLLDSGNIERELWQLAPAHSVARPATFNLSAEKRTSLHFAIEHLAKEAAPTPAELALAAGGPLRGPQI